MNVNTKDYWDKRFSSGDWENKRGRIQTRQFAETQVKYLKIAQNFSGTIIDYGCGLGDAMPVYRAAYPYASLVGMDISEVAIKKCREIYGEIAKFIQGDYTEVPEVDVIIASNIFEHLSNDIRIADYFLSKCHDLFIITPYRELLTPGAEHINSYDEGYFQALRSYDYLIYASKGWGEAGWRIWFNIHMKNTFRPIFGKKTVSRPKQIMFHFIGSQKPVPFKNALRRSGQDLELEKFENPVI